MRSFVQVLKGSAFALLLACAPAHVWAALAGTPAITMTPDTAEDFQGTAYTLGYSFTVGAPNQQVVALGYYDEGGAKAMTTSHDVGLYDHTGNLLASVTVTTGSTLDNYFRYENLSSPVTLTTGETYYVGGESGTTDPATDTPTSIQLAPGVTFVQPQYQNGATLAWPQLTNGPGFYGWFGASFRLASNNVVVPMLDRRALLLLATVVTMLAFAAMRSLARARA